MFRQGPPVRLYLDVDTMAATSAALHYTRSIDDHIALVLAAAHNRLLMVDKPPPCRHRNITGNIRPGNTECPEDMTTSRIYARTPNCPSRMIFVPASQFHIYCA